MIRENMLVLSQRVPEVQSGSPQTRLRQQTSSEQVYRGHHEGLESFRLKWTGKGPEIEGNLLGL